MSRKKSACGVLGTLERDKHVFPRNSLMGVSHQTGYGLKKYRIDDGLSGKPNCGESLQCSTLSTNIVKINNKLRRYNIFISLVCWIMELTMSATWSCLRARFRGHRRPTSKGWNTVDFRPSVSITRVRRKTSHPRCSPISQKRSNPGSKKNRS
jgi:hypothetical protein